MSKVICSSCGSETDRDISRCLTCGRKLPEDNGRRKALYKKAILGTVLFTVLGFFLYQYLYRASAHERIMEETVKRLNSLCPVDVDEDTRLNNVILIPDNTLQYNYTLVNLDRDEVDTLEFKKLIEPGLISNAQTNPQMEYFRYNKVGINFSYRDRNGDYVCMISFDPDRYK